ncbi:hypothetical protein BsWGS_19733 [Bradybaena similaris]
MYTIRAEKQKSAMLLAATKAESRKNLTMMPKNYVIMAKRISQGGELLLVKKPSENTTEICESDTRKGRVCILGPLAELIAIKGIKTRQVTKDCHTAGRSRNDPVMMRSTAPDALFMYQQFKLDIKALRPKEAKEKEELKPVPEQQGKSEPIEEPRIPEELQPLMEPDSKVVDDSKPPDQSGKTKKRIGKKQIGQVDPSKIFGDIQPKNRFGNLPSAPLSSISEFSVLVKWKQHPSIPCYSLKNVYDILSEFGIVAAMGHLSFNSCLVLFEQFSVAVNVVREALIGPKAYPLICTWYYSYMYLDSLEILDIHPYRKHKVDSEESKKLKQFREMQENVIACLKQRGAGLSYDRRAFKA